MIYGSFTPPGFTGDDHDEADREPLTPEQIAAMNEVWPQFAEKEECPDCNGFGVIPAQSDLYDGAEPCRTCDPEQTYVHINVERKAA